MCCEGRESRKTPILAAIKRSISIVLKLAFSLRFSFVLLLQFFALPLMLRCCYTTITIAVIATTKSSLHFGFALLSFRFVIVYISRFLSCACFVCGPRMTIRFQLFHFKQTALALAKKIKMKWLVNATQWILKTVLNVVLFQRENDEEKIKNKNNVHHWSRQSKGEWNWAAEKKPLSNNIDSISNDNFQNTENDVKCCA